MESTRKQRHSLREDSQGTSVIVDPQTILGRHAERSAVSRRDQAPDSPDGVSSQRHLRSADRNLMHVPLLFHPRGTVFRTLSAIRTPLKLFSSAC